MHIREARRRSRGRGCVEWSRRSRVARALSGGSESVLAVQTKRPSSKSLRPAFERGNWAFLGARRVERKESKARSCSWTLRMPSLLLLGQSAGLELEHGPER